MLFRVSRPPERSKNERGPRKQAVHMIAARNDKNQPKKPSQNRSRFSSRTSRVTLIVTDRLPVGSWFSLRSAGTPQHLARSSGAAQVPRSSFRLGDYPVDGSSDRRAASILSTGDDSSWCWLSSSRQRAGSHQTTGFSAFRSRRLCLQSGVAV